MDEMRRLREVAEWQHEALKSLRTVLLPDTYLETLKSLREKTFEIEDCIIDEVDEKLTEQLEIFTSNLEQGKQLINMVNGFTEITKDDYNRAIFVFTVVTVIFLPLSFVAAYLSMADGPSSEDWAKTQSLFWQIAAPLAIGIGIFCIAVAWQGGLKTIQRWMDNYLRRFKQ